MASERTMATGAERLPTLHIRLRASRRRLAAGRVAGLVVWSLLIGLATLVALELVRLFFGPEWFLSRPRLLTELLPASLVVVASLATGLLRILRTLPSLDELAILAERHYGLSERLSSALEVADEESHGLLHWALLHDAEEQARLIEPPRLVPISPPRSLRLLPVPLVVLGVLQFLPVTTGFSDTAGGVAQAEEAYQAETSEDESREVELIARLVEELAEQEDDAYLSAVARSYRELADRVTSGEIDSEGLDGELSQLADHLERALGEDVADGTELFEQLPPSLAAAKTRLEAREAAAAAARERAAAAAAAGESEPGSSPEEAGYEDMFRQLSFDFTPDVDEPAEPRPRAPGEVIGSSGDYTNIDPEVLADLERRRQEAAMRTEGQGDVPVGAAQESNEGAGDMAGEGTQPLERGAVGEGDAADAEREQVTLPEGDPRGGRRIEVELPPATVYTLVEEIPQTDSEWAKARESATTSTIIGISNRDVVSRYFLPSNRSAEDASVSNAKDDSNTTDRSIEGMN